MPPKYVYHKNRRNAGAHNDYTQMALVSLPVYWRFIQALEKEMDTENLTRLHELNDSQVLHVQRDDNSEKENVSLQEASKSGNTFKNNDSSSIIQSDNSFKEINNDTYSEGTYSNDNKSNV